MDLELDESSLKVIKKLFEWSDSDGDGFISREDLNVSIGIDSEKEVNEIFSAIKKSGGGNPNDLFISYEEFCKGVMDFPFLIEQFKNEFVFKPLEIEIAEQDESSYGTSDMQRESQRDTQMEFVTLGLRNIISIYTRLLKIEISVDSSAGIEDLLEYLRITLEKVMNKYKKDGDIQTYLINGSIDLYLLVRDLTTYHQDLSTQYKDEIDQQKLTITDIQEKYDKLVQENEKLLEQLEFIEHKAIKTTKAHTEILEEKQNLQQKLEKAKDKEKNFQEQFEYIESIISSKEKAIAQLEKDLRQLNSYKVIQEMRGASGRTAEDMKIRRLTRNSYRQSVPVKDLLSPRRLQIPCSPRFDFKFQFISSQLKIKDEKFKTTQSQLNELEYKLEKSLKEIDKLKEENNKLHDKIHEIQFEFNNKYIESRESSILPIVLPSLYDEIMLAKERTTDNLTLHTRSGVLIEVKDKQTQYIVNVKGKSTQTILPGFKESSHSCFSCF
jgi:DNA repair exonuclease SbcCD ATPase subunit